MAHFKKGYVQVKLGNAVRIGQLLGGDPLPMTFDGRFLVLGDRINLSSGNAS